MNRRKPTYKVLCVDDDPDVVDGIRLGLRDRYVVLGATHPADGLAIAAEQSDIAAVIADMRMPSIDGAEFLAQISTIRPEAARILLTGHSDFEASVKAVNRGNIFRFLIKPVSRDNLREFVDEAVEHFLENQRVSNLIMSDPLTGLRNRRGAMASVEKLERLGITYSLAFGDLDRFKALNDHHGHDVGDDALCIVADVMTSVTRSNDVVCRWGGEEFLLILPVTAADRVQSVVDRIRKALACRLDELDVPRFTISFGVCGPEITGAFDLRLKQADAALLRAKADGRDRVVRVA